MKVNRYIQSKLGLENFERSGSGRYGATSSGAHVNTRDDISYTQEGDAWLKQVRSDYRKFFIDQPPYRCERMNGVTFRMIYADEKANPTYEVIHSYVPTGSYKAARNVKVEKISDSGLMTQRGIVVTEVEPESEDFILGKSEYDNKVFTSVEQMPQYPGGDAALLADIDKNLRYPSVAMENGIEGKVVVKFVVTKIGTVGEVKVVRGKDPDLDKEAKRVVKTLKRFNPGKINGKPVSVWYTLPITFKLHNSKWRNRRCKSGHEIVFDKYILNIIK